MIENLPKGAVPDTVDERDYQIMAAPAVVDWNNPFELPEPPDADQGSSDSCVSQSWSYYHWQLHGKDYSRRDLFCRIALAYGAQIRDGGLEVVKNGQATRSEVSDPVPQTPQNMRDRTGTSQDFRNDDKELNSFVLAKDIDTVAWAIKTYKGVVFGVWGNNDGWHDLENPEPPSPNTDNWGHALYLFGYHMHNGQKCVIAKSSWCNTGVKRHHIKDNYFKAGMTFNPWTLIPKELTNKPMYKKAVHLDGKTFGVLIITPNGAQVIDATSEEVWRSFSKAGSYQLNTVNPSGSTNFSTDDCVKLPW